MKDEAFYRDALPACSVVPLQARGHRVAPGTAVVKNMTFDRLWCGVAAGRCNPSGIKRIYAALGSATAAAEYAHILRSAGLDPEAEETFHYAIDLELTAVLDLTDAAQRKTLRLTKRDMIRAFTEDPAKPQIALQVIGSLIAGGLTSCCGIVFPSARMVGGKNVVVFPLRLRLSYDLVQSTSDPASRLP